MAESSNLRSGWTPTRRTVLAALAASAAPFGASAQTSQMRIVWPFAAGGSGDALSRILADGMAKALGETIIVEARPGAGGQIGVRSVIAGPADGRTMLLTPVGPISIFPIVYPKLPYDPFNDLVPVTQLVTFDFALVVNPATPAKTLAELVGWLKQDAKRRSFGSPGAGTLPHFFGAMWSEAAGVPLSHAVYRGSSASLADLVGGQVPMVMTNTADVLEFARSGTLRVLAVSGKARSPMLPDVPTFKESGYDLTGSAWYGLYVKAGTAPDAIVRIRDMALAALRTDAIKQRVEQLGMVPTGTTSEELAAIQKADYEAWQPAVKASGFKPTE